MTAPDAASLRPFAVFTSLRRLRPRGIVVWEAVWGRRRLGFAPMAWPPRLGDFHVERTWESQPAGNVQQRLLFGSFRGWDMDIRVFFATQHPDRALVTKAQTELNRLRVPRG